MQEMHISTLKNLRVLLINNSFNDFYHSSELPIPNLTLKIVDIIYYKLSTYKSSKMRKFVTSAIGSKNTGTRVRIVAILSSFIFALSTEPLLRIMVFSR